MSILLFLNDKCFYFQILLKLGRISRDIYINFFNKKIEMVPIHAPDIADLHCFFYNVIKIIPYTWSFNSILCMFKRPAKML